MVSRIFAGCLSLVICALSFNAAAGLPDTIAHIKPSIVVITTFSKLRRTPTNYKATGFVVGDGKTVVTNAHAVSDPLEPDEVLLIAVPGTPEPRLFEARVVSRDPAHDLALLRIDSALPALKLGSAILREGQEIFFTGFPIVGALGPVPITHRGIVSALTPTAMAGGNAGQLNAAAIRQLRSGPFMVYQLDATAYPGSSGSPMFDSETGEVVGIVNSGFVKGSKESALSAPSGITYAIPVKFLNDLLSGSAREH